MDFSDKSSYSLNKKIVTFAVIGILILINILSVRYFLRFDMTENEQFSISDSTVSILQGLDDLVTVKAYFTSDLPPQFLPTAQYLRDILSEYKAYGRGNFDYEFVDPAEDEEAAQEAQRVGVRQVRMQVIENDSFQTRNGYLGLGIFYEAQSEAIPLIQEQQLANFEYDLTSLILKMTQPRTMVVGFLQGHGEHVVGPELPPGIPQEGSDYAAVTQVLRQSYEVKTVDFAKNDTLDEVDVLVVAGAKRDLTERDIFEIDQYFMRGGKAIFLIDGVVQLDGGVTAFPQSNNLNTLFSGMGITVESNLLLDKLSELTQFQEGPGRIFLLQYPPFIRLVSDNFTGHPVVAKIPSLVVRFVSSITVTESEGLKYDRFINTSPASWSQSERFNVNPNAIPPPSPDDVGSKAVAVSVSGVFPRLSDSDDIPTLQEWVEIEDSTEFELRFVKDDENRNGREVLKESQAEAGLIVFSDSDFITDAFIRGDQTALVVFQNMVDNLTIGDELISIRSKSIGSADIRELENSEKTLMKFLGIALMPLIVSIYGMFRLWARRREERMLKIN